MALSVNPFQIIEIFQRKKQMDQSQTADFLDEVAREAIDLANIWSKASSSIQHGTREERVELLELALQTGPAWRLRHFYNSITSTLGNQLPKQRRDTVIDIIAKVLIKRDATKAIYENFILQSSQSVFLDDRNQRAEFEDLSQSAEALQREAAALHVLAKAYRASGK